ncbi:MAG: hypothetical protein C4K49_10785 [Candidatus Thorarchaeota archaeon]|nr:MAG: hypothetical protein C4K49_10785 [Candidatus Thorarchaeota archaeon]
MEVNRERLLQSLQNAIVGSEKGEFLNNAFSFKDGYVHTFKDFVALSIHLGDEFKFLKGSIRATEFFSLLSKYTMEKVDINVLDNGLEVCSGRSKALFTFLEESVLKQVDNMALESLVWYPMPDDFRDALSFCLLGVREYNLEGVRVKGKLALSVDSKRVNYFEMKETAGDFLLEEKVVTELLKFQDFVQLAQSDQRVFVKLGDGTIVSGRRKMDVDYPLDKITAMIEQITPTEEDPKGKLPTSFKSMIGRASVLSSEMSGLAVIKMVFDKEFIEASSERATGKYDEKLDWEEIPAGLDQPITVFLESSAALYALEKSRTFAIKSTEGLKRLVFIGDNCKCFLAAYTEGKE